MRHKIKTAILLGGDIFCLYAALFFSLALRSEGRIWTSQIQNHIIPFGINFALWLMIFGAFGLYELKSAKTSKNFALRLGQATFFNILVSSSFFYFFPFFEIEPRRNLLATAALAALFIYLWRYVLAFIFIKTPPARILFLGKNAEIAGVYDYLAKNPELGQRPLGFIDLEKKDLGKTLQRTKANTIVITNEIKGNETLVKALFQAIPLGIAIVEFDRYFEMLMGKVPLTLIKEVWFLENLVGIKKQIYEFFKRMLDIFIAILASIPTLLLLPCIAIAIKLDSRGPTFFRQKRVGRGGKVFKLWKFRSMVKDAEYLGGLKGEGYDVRLTRIGTVLRKSYLDELPQIINVLRGEMSFVGPRPERPEYVEELKKIVPFYEMRLLVQPGITGWAQVNMEDDASVEDAPEKMQYDLYYVKNRSFILDLLIALRTLSAILRRQGR